MKIEDDILLSIEKKEKFIDFVENSFYSLSEGMGLLPYSNRALLQDAFFQWHQDLSRIRSYENNVGEPDHLKKSAHLIYWLRRFSPVNDFVIVENPLETASAESVDFMLKYGREYLAFTLGYEIAKHYETKINDVSANSFSLQSSFEGVPKNDLVETIVHAMKVKMISPQGMLITLKAVFLRP